MFSLPFSPIIFTEVPLLFPLIIIISSLGFYVGAKLIFIENVY